MPVTQALLLEGRRVNFGGLFEVFTRVRGVFNSAADSFDPTRHSVDVGANPGSRLREGVRQNANVVKDEGIVPAPNLVEFRDLGSGTSNDQVTTGNIGEVVGNRLKFDSSQSDEGIYFVPSSDPTAEVKVTAVQDNKPSRLIFLVPDGLTAEDHTLQVRARSRGGAELRTGTLDQTLQVVTGA